MADQDALGPAGRARGIEHVGQVVEGRLPACGPSVAPRGHALGDRPYGHRHGYRHRAVGEQQARAGIGEQVGLTLGGKGRVDRHVGGSHPQGREQGDDGVDRAVGEDRHPRARHHPVGFQGRGQGLDPGPQTAEGQLAVRLAEGDPLGLGVRAGTNRGQHGALWRRPGGRGPERSQRAAVVVGADIDPRDRGVGIGEQGIEHPAEVRQRTLLAPRRQHVVVDVEVQRGAAGGTEIVNLEAHGVGPIAVAGMHPGHRGRHAGEVAEGLGYEIEHHIAGRDAGGGAGTGSRVAQEALRLRQAGSAEGAKGLVGGNLHAEGEHLDEQPDGALGSGVRPAADRGVEANGGAAAHTVQPAHHQGGEEREARHRRRQAGEPGRAGHPLEGTRGGCVEDQGPARAGGRARLRRPAIEGHDAFHGRQPVPMRARRTIRALTGRGAPDQGGRGRIVVAQRRNLAATVTQARVRSRYLPVDQDRRPGIGDQVVLIQVPARPAVFERHQDAVDQPVAELQRPTAAVLAPPQEPVFGARVAIGCATLGETVPGRSQPPPRAAVALVHDGAQGVAGVGHLAPGALEAFVIEPGRKNPGERHVVERPVGVEALADPDRGLGRGQRAFPKRPVARGRCLFVHVHLAFAGW